MHSQLDQEGNKISSDHTFHSLDEALKQKEKVFQLILQGEDVSRMSEAGKFKNLSKLVVYSNQAINFPEAIYALKLLKEISVFGKVDSVPRRLEELKELFSFELEDASALDTRSLHVLKKLHSLRILRLRKLSKTNKLDSSCFKMDLHVLDITGSPLDKLPFNISCLPFLEEFCFSASADFKNPEQFHSVLKKIHVQYENCESLNKSLMCFGRIPTVKSLELEKNSAPLAEAEVPISILLFKGLRKLVLKNNLSMNGDTLLSFLSKLQDFQELVLESSLDKITMSLCKLKKLNTLYISRGVLTDPGIFKCCTALRDLTVYIDKFQNENSFALPPGAEKVILGVQSISQYEFFLNGIGNEKSLKILVLSSSFKDRKNEIRKRLPDSCKLTIMGSINVGY
jgi:hypothetical protein